MSDTLRDIARQVREQADIVGVIERYMPLKKAGGSFKGLCPFHKEKTPSFNVVPAKGIFHCFGCGASGSVIDFVMKVERIEFMDALRQLAKELNIAIPERDGRGPTPEQRDAADKKMRSLQGVNEFALQWFRDNLAARRNAKANATIVSRDITPEMIEAFKLGAALEGWDQLAQAARAKGYSDELLIDAGLGVRSETRGTVYDRFRDRLIFPIFDHLGRVVGFGGRRLNDDPESPKYLNSAETELYKKGRTLYALDVAQKAISDAGFAILTEGYMDALMAHRFGFAQAVASLGTALTSDQARLLKRFAPRVFLLYDGDEAGRKAMLRAGGPLLEAGLDVRVVVLPREHDPDSYLRALGAGALGERIAEATEYFNYALDATAEGLDLDSIDGQGRLVESLAPLLLSLRNDVAREAAITRMLGRLGGLPKQAVYNMLERAKQKKPGTSEGVTPDGRATARPAFDALDRVALKVMLESFEGLQVLRAELSEAWLRDPVLEPWIVFLLFGEESTGLMIENARENNSLPGDLSIITALMADESLRLGDPIHTAHQILARMKKRHLQAISRQLIKSLGDLDEEFPDRTLRMIHEECLLAFRTEIPGAVLDIM